MDIFCEYIVRHRKTAKDYAIILASYIAAAFLSIIIMGYSTYLMGFWLLLVVGAWYGAYFITKNRYVEYEYILTNNELDIDKICAKTRRKRIITVDFKNIEICACVNDTSYTLDYQNVPQKVYDFTGASDYDKYFVDFRGKESRVRVLFQPTDKMKESLKLINPGCVNLL